MRTALIFARKEALEILRTWRIFVLPSIMLLFAISGPLIARYTPELLTAVAGNQFAGLKLPTPTPLDAYAQWIKNLSQIVLFAIVIIYGGIVSGERRSGTAVLVLTKPVSRATFVIVKAITHALFLTALLVGGTLITWALTAILFGNAPGAALWSSSLTWLALGIVYLCLMTLFSVLVPSAAGAAGIGLGAFMLFSIGSLWRPIADYSPAGLSGRATTLAAGTETHSVLWPVTVSLLVCVAAIGLAAAIFRRQEV